MADEGDIRNIVVIGGGIIGCTTAYFLTRHPKYDRTKHRIALLESTKIAGGASGKAGGLLALWAYPKNIVPLSYRLHAQLAAEHDGAERWGYRGVHCGQLMAHGRRKSADKKTVVEDKIDGNSVSLQKRSQAALKTLRAAGVPPDLDWVATEGFMAYEQMGNPNTTAQVHPYLFTTSMAQLAEAEGVEIILGRVTELGMPSGKMESVSYIANGDDENAVKTIPASTVILAAGPWTRSVYPPAPISALRAHSVTIRPTRPVSAYALFTEITLPEDSGKRSRAPKRVSPEIYARPNNEVYACGEGDTLVPVPVSTDLVEVDDRRCQDVVDYVGSISDELCDGEVTARQACYLPNVDGAVAGPLIGGTGVQGLLMATGHTCWGIQNAPATGKLISEFVFDGRAKSANVAALNPQLAL
ncbi:MAG: hypothetical protein M1823_002735 [Watsoniomyces obsoletus]|nr:MAG: hypothetical protein M1823_002735 [Watsoniomyces obsoletus]